MCGVKFTESQNGVRNRRVYCSQLCFDQVHKKECAYCGRMFNKSHQRPGSLFCSRLCAKIFTATRKWEKRRDTKRHGRFQRRHCLYCGKEFIVKYLDPEAPSQGGSPTGWGVRRQAFCSQSCSGSYHAGYPPARKLMQKKQTDNWKRPSFIENVFRGKYHLPKSGSSATAQLRQQTSKPRSAGQTFSLSALQQK